MKKLIASTALPCLKRPGNCLWLASGGPTYTESSCLIDYCKDDEFTVRKWTLNGSFECFSMQWSARIPVAIAFDWYWKKTDSNNACIHFIKRCRILCNQGLSVAMPLRHDCFFVFVPFRSKPRAIVSRFELVAMADCKLTTFILDSLAYHSTQYFYYFYNRVHYVCSVCGLAYRQMCVCEHADGHECSMFILLHDLWESSMRLCLCCLCSHISNMTLSTSIAMHLSKDWTTLVACGGGQQPGSKRICSRLPAPP
jgi:hypothetical protein